MKKIEKNLMVIALLSIGIGFIFRALKLEQYPIYFLALGGLLLLVSGLIHGFRSLKENKK